jgi:hypothetical protein
MIKLIRLIRKMIKQHPAKDSDWCVLQSFNDAISASVCEFVLKEAGIPFNTLNQQDSSYLAFGQIHVQVYKKDLEEARKVLISQHE